MKQDPAFDPSRIAKMAYDINASNAKKKVFETSDKQRRDSNINKMIAIQPEWAILENVKILKIKDFNIAAFPISGKENSRYYQVFDIITREPICQLKKSEVNSWLVRAYLTTLDK